MTFEMRVTEYETVDEFIMKEYSVEMVKFYTQCSSTESSPGNSDQVKCSPLVAPVRPHFSRKKSDHISMIQDKKTNFKKFKKLRIWRAYRNSQFATFENQIKAALQFSMDSVVSLKPLSQFASIESIDQEHVEFLEPSLESEVAVERDLVADLPAAAPAAVNSNDASHEAAASAQSTEEDDDDDEVDQVYEVEKVVGMRKRRTRIEYLLKWKGYPESENTWEPVENLGCKDLIREFHAKQAKEKKGGNSKSQKAASSSSSSAAKQEQKSKKIKRHRIDDDDDTVLKELGQEHRQKLIKDTGKEIRPETVLHDTQPVVKDGGAKKFYESSVAVNKREEAMKALALTATIPSHKNHFLKKSATGWSTAVQQTSAALTSPSPKKLVQTKLSFKFRQGSSVTSSARPLKDDTERDIIVIDDSENTDSSNSSQEAGATAKKEEVTCKKESLTRQRRSSSVISETNSVDSSKSNRNLKVSIKIPLAAADPAKSIAQLEHYEQKLKEEQEQRYLKALAGNSTVKNMVKQISAGANDKPETTRPLRSAGPISLSVPKFTLTIGKKKTTPVDQTAAWQHIIGKARGPPISVINDVDDEPPPNFTYIEHSIFHSDIPPFDRNFLLGCSCEFGCHFTTYSTEFCLCSDAHQGLHPYDSRGRVLLSPRSVIYECNSNCACPPACQNRLIQHGPQYRLQIFRTANGRGWGVRALEPIPCGAFVATYTGEVITNQMAEKRGQHYDAIGRTYLFDLDFFFSHAHGDPADLFTVDGFTCGNISHFFNHSCRPNLDVYAALIEITDPRFHEVAFFAACDIKAGDELTFDYTGGEAALSSRKQRRNAELQQSPNSIKYVPCLCGAVGCRGRIPL